MPEGSQGGPQGLQGGLQGPPGWSPGCPGSSRVVIQGGPQGASVWSPGGPPGPKGSILAVIDDRRPVLSKERFSLRSSGHQISSNNDNYGPVPDQFLAVPRN